MLSFIAPTSSDKEFVSTLARDLTYKNIGNTAYSLTELIHTSDEITKQELYEFIEGANALIKNGYINEITPLIKVFSDCDKTLFNAEELKLLLSNLIKLYPDGPYSCTNYILNLCSKSINNESDFNTMIDNPFDMIIFVTLAGDPLCLNFLVKCVEFCRPLRVPFVFNGILDQIIHSLKDNHVHLHMFSMLIDDPQSRQYFLQMNYLPSFTDFFFNNDIDESMGNAFCSLVNPQDFTSFFAIQEYIFKHRVHTEFVFKYNNKYVLRCLTSLFRYRKFDSLPLPKDFLVNVPEHNTFDALRLIESISDTNPFIFDESYLNTNNDYIKVFLHYIIYRYTGRPPSQDLPSSPLYLLLIYANTRNVPFENAFNISQTHEVEYIRSLAAMNLILSRAKDQPLSTLLSNALSFKPPTEIFVPNSFSIRFQCMFSESGICSLLRNDNQYTFVSHNVFNQTPDESHKNLINVERYANEISKENSRWKVKYDTVLEQYDSISKELGKMQIELMKRRSEKL